MAAYLMESLPHCHDVCRMQPVDMLRDHPLHHEGRLESPNEAKAEGGWSSSAVEGGMWIPADFSFSYSFSFCNCSTYFSSLLPYMLSHLFLYDTMRWVLKLSLFWKKNRIVCFWKTALWCLIYNKLLIQSVFFLFGDFTISLKMEHCFWYSFLRTLFFSVLE